MGLRDSQYKLQEVIELDEGFFSTEMEESEKDKPLKRGRGSQKKTKVLVMAESIPVDKPQGKDGKPRKVNHLRMLVIDDLKAATIDKKVIENISHKAVIYSDNSTSYTNFSKLVQEHRPRVIPKEETSKALP